MIKLFLSSVSRGLEQLREQIIGDLHTATFEVHNMEIFGARPDLPLEVCLKELRKCDAAVVIVGPRYGSLTPAGDVSFTHEEYREACRRGLRVMAFVLPVANGVDDEERKRLEAFEQEVGGSVVYKRTTPDDLRADILATLHQRIQAGELGRRFAFFQTVGSLL